MISQEHKTQLKHRIILAVHESPEPVAELVKLVEEVELSYGNCQNCYGKGYGTRRTGGTTSLGDFIGDPDVHIPEKTVIVFCDCGRGQALERVLEERHGV